MCNDTHSLASGDSRARTVASSTWLSRPPRIKDATGLSESFHGTCEAPSMPSGTIVAVRPREHHEHHEHHQQCVDHHVQPVVSGSSLGCKPPPPCTFQWSCGARQVTTSAKLQTSLQLNCLLRLLLHLLFSTAAIAWEMDSEHSNTTSTRLLNHIIPKHSFRNQPMFLFSMSFAASAPVSPPCPPVQIGVRSLWNSAKGPNCARLSRSWMLQKNTT